jgi:hypothetical protein
MITPRAVPVLLPAHHRRVASHQAITKPTLPTPWPEYSQVKQILASPEDGHRRSEQSRQVTRMAEPRSEDQENARA